MMQTLIHAINLNVPAHASKKFEVQKIGKMGIRRRRILLLDSWEGILHSCIPSEHGSPREVVELSRIVSVESSPSSDVVALILFDWPAPPWIIAFRTTQELNEFRDLVCANTEAVRNHTTSLFSVIKVCL